jgi:hypothetical protein
MILVPVTFNAVEDDWIGRGRSEERAMPRLFVPFNVRHASTQNLLQLLFVFLQSAYEFRIGRRIGRFVNEGRQHFAKAEFEGNARLKRGVARQGTGVVSAVASEITPVWEHGAINR